MINKRDIHEFLLRCGIKPSDTVLIHTSMRAIGGVEGGCDGLIDAFTEYLADGLFIVPTHTWAQIGENNPVFDPRTEKPCIGALPCVAAFRKDGVRSLHPTHSVAAFGKRAEELVRGEEKATTPAFPNGVWWRLREEKARILLIGVGLNRNTFIHAVDEMLDLPNRLCDPIPLTVVGYGGERYSLSYRKHNDHTGSENFGNYEPALYKCGAMDYDRLGEAEVRVISADKCADVIERVWSNADFDLTKERRELPERLYENMIIRE